MSLNHRHEEGGRSMPNVDFKKQLRRLYQPSAGKFSVIDVPEMNFLMVDGQGDPQASREYQEATEALYAAAFQLKSTVGGRDPEIYSLVPPLEGLWWAENMEAFTTDDREAWLWTAMIVLPDDVSQELFQECVQGVKQRKDLPGLARMRLERYHEGLSVQILHIGPYADLGPMVEKLHAFAKEKDYRLRGKHHEIYLNDPQTTAPEKLKTIIRQPVESM
jgi:hypothetical protein